MSVRLRIAMIMISVFRILLVVLVTLIGLTIPKRRSCVDVLMRKRRLFVSIRCECDGNPVDSTHTVHHA